MILQRFRGAPDFGPGNLEAIVLLARALRTTLEDRTSAPWQFSLAVSDYLYEEQQYAKFHWVLRYESTCFQPGRKDVYLGDPEISKDGANDYTIFKTVRRCASGIGFRSGTDCWTRYVPQGCGAGSAGSLPGLSSSWRDRAYVVA
jgi:hypothetical protein